MIDINKVAIFVLVAQTGSFTVAAKKLCKPSNTISRNIKELEDELGVRLIHRTTRKLTLTNAGLALFENSEAAIRTISNATENLKTSNDLCNGIVRISAPTGFFDFFKHEWINQFLVQNAGIELHFNLTDKVLDLVDNNIDIALRGGGIGNSNLVTRKLFVDNDILVASPLYISKNGLPKNSDSLSKHNCLLRLESGGQAIWKLEGPNGYEEVSVSGNFIVDSIHELINASIQHLGIGLFPSTLVFEAIKSGKLTRVLPNFKSQGFKINFVCLNRENRPKAALEFMNYLADKHLQQKLIMEESGYLDS